MIHVGFSTSNSLVSRTIRAITRSRVSHAFLVIDDEPFFNVPMVMEAIGSGVSFITLTQFQQNNTIISLLMPPVPLEPSVRKAAEWLGERYAYGGLFGMLVVQAGRWFKRRWQNPVHASHALFCSEMVALIAQDAGWPGTAALDPYSTNPEDLLECLTPTAFMPAIPHPKPPNNETN